MLNMQRQQNIQHSQAVETDEAHDLQDILEGESEKVQIVKQDLVRICNDLFVFAIKDEGSQTSKVMELEIDDLGKKCSAKSHTAYSELTGDIIALQPCQQSQSEIDSKWTNSDRYPKLKIVPT